MRVRGEGKDGASEIGRANSLLQAERRGISRRTGSTMGLSGRERKKAKLGSEPESERGFFSPLILSVCLPDTRENLSLSSPPAEETASAPAADSLNLLSPRIVSWQEQPVCLRSSGLRGHEWNIPFA